ncbi:MAG: alpha/beta hydrolase [Betaproteobacteria bacterium]|nr:alpha/beta hydrolase [Betaproteobacteria bacterium]
MRLLGTLLIGIVLGYAALAALLFVFQSRFIYFPEIGRQDRATPAQLRLPYEDVRITTTDGENLHGWFVPAAQARAAVLFFHGNAGSIVHRLDWLPMFQQLRLSVLLVDYRGFGASTGSPSEAGTHVDAEAAWRFLTETRGIPAGRIVVMGESLGGAVAARLAARVHPAALVLHSAFTSAPDLAADLYPFLPARLLTRFDYNTLDAVMKLRCPLLVAHSPGDEIVPVAHGRRLHDAATVDKQWLELAGGHNDGFLFMRAEWINAFDAFMRRHLPAGSG